MVPRVQSQLDGIVFGRVRQVAALVKRAPSPVGSWDWCRDVIVLRYTGL